MQQQVRINAIDADEEITLVSVQDDADKKMFDVDALNGQNENVDEEVVDAVQVSTAATTVTITTKEITLAQAHEALKTSKTKVKGIVFQEPEPVKPMKKKDQISFDEETALKLQAKFEEEEGLAREKAKKEKEANIALIEEWDDIQAKIDRKEESILQLKEHKRKEKTTNKSSTEKDNVYLPIEHGRIQDQRFEVKKQKVEDDKEIVELKQLMKIIPDEEEVAIYAIPLAVKSPSIVGWKIYKEGRKSYYQIMRVDGKSQMYMFFSQMLKKFNSEDLKDLYKLVKAKFESTKPVEDLDLLLWGDLKIIVEPHVEDTVWRNQQAYKVLDWKLYDSCGAHSLRMQHMQIYMLVEKKYPLAPLTLSMMLEKKLNIDYESKMAYQLLKLIIKQLRK
ncbi:hypothetical protein Tco_0631007 [Tanacetum coccineum]